MARDLEHVRLPVRQAGLPARPTVQPVLPSEPRHVRVAGPASPSQGGPAPQEAPKSREDVRGDERRDEQRLSDILRIARQRVEAPAPPKALADILPIEPLDATRGKPPVDAAPSNLPIDLPVRQAGLAPAPTAVATKGVPSERQGKTPEEILGLPAAQEGLPIRPASPAVAPQLRGEGVVSPAKRSEPALKFPLVAGALGLAFLAISGGIYWNFFLREQPPPPPVKPSGLVEPQVPKALIGYDQREILEIGELTYDAVKPQIDRLLDGEFLSDSLVYVPVKLVSDTEIKYLTLAEFLTALRIDAPPAFYAADYQDFSLFLYSPGGEEKSVCEEAQILDALCHGPRMGFALKTAAPRDTIFSLMREWEKTIAADLRPLMGAVPRQRVAGDTFSLGRYGDVTTHFLNLPISSISVDWILTDEHLVIATSKNAARRAVDKLQ